MNSELRLLLLDGVEERRKDLFNRLSNFTDIHLDAPEDPVDPETFFSKDASQVVLLDRGYLGDGYGFGGALLENFPEKAVVLLENEPSLEGMKKALQAGFSDVLHDDVGNEELVETILRAQQQKQRNIDLLRDEKQRKVQNSKGKILTVFSTKGGVGRTFTALNMAVLLKQKTDAKVALMDMDFDYGTAAAALGLQGKTTVNHVLGDLRNLDGDLLDSYMLSHESGIKVLAAAGEPQLDSYVNSEQTEIILRTLQSSFDYVVLDMPSRFLEMNSPAFTLASVVFMVTTPEILALNNVKAGLALLKELNFPWARLKILLNRLGRKSLSKGDVEKSLEAPVFISLPEDAAVTTSLNLGIPFVLSNPRSKTTKALEALVEGFVREE